MGSFDKLFGNKTEDTASTLDTTVEVADRAAVLEEDEVMMGSSNVDMDADNLD